MYRIAGVNIPPKKHIWVALTSIYGLGKSLALQVCERAKVEPNTKSGELSEPDVERIREVISAGQASGEYLIEGDLRRSISTAVKRLKDIGCYRGVRHRRRLPVRGQRTRTNARTRKGPKKIIGAKKKA